MKRTLCLATTLRCYTICSFTHFARIRRHQSDVHASVQTYCFCYFFAVSTWRKQFKQNSRTEQNGKVCVKRFLKRTYTQAVASLFCQKTCNKKLRNFVSVYLQIMKMVLLSTWQIFTIRKWINLFAFLLLIHTASNPGRHTPLQISFVSIAFTISRKIFNYIVTV